jgi:hypothetical protein
MIKRIPRVGRGGMGVSSVGLGQQITNVPAIPMSWSASSAPTLNLTSYLLFRRTITMTRLHIRDLANSQELTRQAAAEIRGGRFNRASVLPQNPNESIGWGNGPSIEDAASAGDDSHYYGLPPLR